MEAPRRTPRPGAALASQRTVGAFAKQPSRAALVNAARTETAAMDVLDLIAELRAVSSSEGEDGESDLRRLGEIERRYQGVLRRHEMAECQLEWLDIDPEDPNPECYCHFAATRNVILDARHDLCHRHHVEPCDYARSDEDLCEAQAMLKWVLHACVLQRDRFVGELEIIRETKRTTTLFCLKPQVLCGRVVFDAWRAFVMVTRRGGTAAHLFHDGKGEFLASDTSDESLRDMLEDVATRVTNPNVTKLRETHRVNKQRRTMTLLCRGKSAAPGRAELAARVKREQIKERFRASAAKAAQVAALARRASARGAGNCL